uniref:Uncharacterized protein n=1 Tax=Ananas comosus var. bracteatus TaxID=296719 RepID=A0A6V7P3G9_ANACO|nr:unnamed protein product [Ananas comosus var. bracteatus]
MADQSCSRVRRRWCRRIRVVGLHAKLLTLFRLLRRWLVSKGLMGSCSRNCSGRRNTRRSGRGLATAGLRQEYYSLPSCRRSNSFYAEAIADCLEFIKRTTDLWVAQKPHTPSEPKPTRPAD